MITRIMMCQRNRGIHSGWGFFCSFDAPCSSDLGLICLVNKRKIRFIFLKKRTLTITTLVAYCKTFNELLTKSDCIVNIASCPSLGKALGTSSKYVPFYWIFTILTREALMPAHRLRYKNVPTWHFVPARKSRKRVSMLMDNLEKLWS